MKKIQEQDALWVRPPQSLIDEWDAVLNRGTVSYGKWNEQTGFFNLDFGEVKILDIATEEAINTLRFGTWGEKDSIIKSNASGILVTPRIRATIPSCGSTDQNFNFPTLGWVSVSLQVIKWMSDPLTSVATVFVGNANLNLLSSVKHILDRIKPIISPFFVSYDSVRDPSQYKLPLETIYLYKITGDIGLLHAPNLSLASFRYMVENAANTKAISITVHPDVYAKLTDPDNAEWHQLNQDAAEKQIAFATV